MRVIIASAIAVLSATACHRGLKAPSTVVLTDRSVFTDSLYHAEQCLPLKPGEDWRRVCTPKYQGNLPMPLPEKKP